ncbi:4-trimethylaminobutyraldehyde dehydrogenase-like [Mya arenaria]|uniref:4-trimethylaminobutyraldehyde dehydrogenase-like n=1 Tax=Mya arenaria TaxID=6604 RepID=UPI0022E2B79A|nr:4-trimethylaminobutyraldehyde dehydrogenase-like [Mya arenaria]XP_052796380.1 4-trimethylaminobutyraldehyde dehydrogenase-like [Mya arenaria]XP_052796381.1 4-trimethylaminobutyraldehyde dehydrogenase-like [Mya arenaria]
MLPQGRMNVMWRLARSCSTISSRVAGFPAISQPLNYLAGARVEPSDSSAQFNLQYPATGEVLKTVGCSGSDDVHRAVSKARQAQTGWARMSGFQRGQVLKRAADIVRSRMEELAQLETLDTGKPIWEARFDIQGCADTIEYYGGLASTVTGDFLPLSDGNFSYTIREPLGVVGGIGAWNYPFQMASWKSSPALACGNTFVFKPSQFTPLTAVVLGEIYKEAGLPDGCYNIIQGEAETGQLLCNHPDVDKMSFTGSVPVGSKIMEACAKDIKHVTLELGGKSPLIVFADSHMDNAVGGAMLANFLTQGQVCSNGTRVFVQRSIHDEFLEKLVSRTKKMKIGDPFAEDTTVGATISRQQADKVLHYVQAARHEGAKVECGGEEVTPEPRFAGGQFLSPCVLSGCQDNMQVVRDEVFGSILSLLVFDEEEEVLARANDTEFGLAGGLFTNDLKRAHRVISKLKAGSLYLNNYNIYPVGVPFGGYKKSGIGRENGPEAIEYYTQVKSVYVEMNDVEAPF